MPIDFPTHALSSLSLSLPASAPDLAPPTSWPTEKVFNELLQQLRDLPVSARRPLPARLSAAQYDARPGSMDRAASVAERIYDLASPIKCLLDESEPYPKNPALAERLSQMKRAWTDRGPSWPTR